jgi:hypothetical protein
MPKDKHAAETAADLDLSLEEYLRLVEALRPVREEAVIIITSWFVEQDIEGRQVWEAEIGGMLSLPDLMAEYQFRVVIVNQALWRGSSHTPDWYRITGPEDKILFEGEVECPDNKSDARGWRRYKTFTPIRLPAFDAVFARLATNRPLVDGG